MPNRAGTAPTVDSQSQEQTVREAEVAQSAEQKVKEEAVAFWNALHAFFSDRLYLKDESKRRSSELRRDLFTAIRKSGTAIAAMSTDLKEWASALKREAEPLFDYLSDVELSSLAWTFRHIHLAIQGCYASQDPARALLDINVSWNAFPRQIICPALMAVHSADHVDPYVHHPTTCAVFFVGRALSVPS